VDSSAVAAQAHRIEGWFAGRVPRPEIDPVHEFYGRVLTCPKLLLAPRSTAVAASLDSLCNLR
jgi:hypothetical protein